MYSPLIIDKQQAALESRLKLRLHRYAPEECWAITDHLGDKPREVSGEEGAFIRNEQLVSSIDFKYFAERYCNTPDAPIWMGDFSFKPIGDIKVGDEVIGWYQRPTRAYDPPPCRKQEYKDKRRGRRLPTKKALCKSTVVALSERLAPTVRVYFKSGKMIRCTRDHWWLSKQQKTRTYTQNGECWVHPEKGRVIRHIIDVDVANPDRTKYDPATLGYMRGIYDGEGSHYFIAQSKGANPIIYAEIEKTLKALDIPHFANRNNEGFSINGGRDQYVRFLNLVQPVKRQSLDKRILSFMNAVGDEIVDVQDDGIRRVVSMQTTTGNYVAWGYASKNCIMDLDGGGAGHIKLKESQELVLTRYLIPAEERVAQQLAAGEPTDGILLYWHKARQLYATTTAIMLMWHRLLTIPNSKGLGGVAEDDKLAAYYSRHERLYSGLPWWLRPGLKYESKGEHLVLDGLDSSVWFAAGNQKGGMGQGNQYELQHLTECAFWQMPEYHIDYVLKDTLPQSPRTLAIRESTANGRGNWWHTQTEDARRGYSTWNYIFVPWYAVGEKRRRRPKDSSWRPDPQTIKHAEVVLRTSPEWMGRTVQLDIEQLYWWESERKEMARKNALSLFYSNCPATPEESFQHFTRAAFSAEQIEGWRAETSVPTMAMEVVTRG